MKLFFVLFIIECMSCYGAIYLTKMLPDREFKYNIKFTNLFIWYFLIGLSFKIRMKLHKKYKHAYVMQSFNTNSREFYYGVSWKVRRYDNTRYLFEIIKHREGDKPTEIEYDWKGNITYALWIKDNKLHREYGPARAYTISNKNLKDHDIRSFDWYINDKQMDSFKINDWIITNNIPLNKDLSIRKDYRAEFKLRFH